MIRTNFFHRAFLAFVTMLFAAGGVFAQPYVYVAHFSSDDITVIDVARNEIAGGFSLGAPDGGGDKLFGAGEKGAYKERNAHIDDIVGSPDGKILYVNRGIDTGHKLGWPTSGEIVAVSTKTEKPLWRVTIDEGWPHHLSLSSDGRYLYAPLFDRPFVVVVDTKKRRVSKMLDTFWGGHGTRLSADDRRLYVGSIMTSNLYVVDVETNSIVNLIPFRDGVRPFAFDREETVFYTQLSRLHGFAVADLKTARILKTVELPDLPEDFETPPHFPNNVNHGLELTPDEKYLVALGTAVNKAYVYSHPDLEMKATIDIGNDANWIVFSPDSRFAYITNRGDNTVSIVDMTSFQEIRRLPTGGERPGRMRLVAAPERP